MESSKKNLRYVIGGLMVLAVVLVGWEYAVRAGLVSTLALPLPSKVLIAIAQGVSTKTFLTNWLGTLATWLSSLICGLVIGLLLGFVSGAYRGIYLALLPLLSFLRSIPPIAMFPVALVAIGPGKLSVGLVATLGAALYVFPWTAEAAKEAADRFSQLAIILGAGRGQFLRVFVAPGAALHAVASSRVAATYAFAVCVAGEMIIGGRTGVGAAILDLSERYRLEEAYSYVLCTGLVGLLIDSAFSRIGKMRRISGNRKSIIYQ